VSRSIGEIEFSFFHRWFDVIFVLSACACIILFTGSYALRASRSSGMSPEEKEAFKGAEIELIFEPGDGETDAHRGGIGGSGKSSPQASPRRLYAEGSGASTLLSGEERASATALFAGSLESTRKRGGGAGASALHLPDTPASADDGRTSPPRRLLLLRTPSATATQPRREALAAGGGGSAVRASFWSSGIHHPDSDGKAGAAAAPRGGGSSSGDDSHRPFDRHPSGGSSSSGGAAAFDGFVPRGARDRPRQRGSDNGASGAAWQSHASASGGDAPAPALAGKAPTAAAGRTQYNADRAQLFARSFAKQHEKVP
jgi:hypothetical protein